MSAAVRTSWPGLVLVAGMLVMAGCGGGFPARAPPTQTVTPAPVPSPATAAESSAIPTASGPPGVTSRRVTDAVALAHAHNRTLAASSYTVTVDETTWATNGSRRSHVASTIQVSRDGRQEVRVITAAGPAGHPPVFSNATRVRMYAEKPTVYVRGTNTTESALAATDAPVQYARRDWGTGQPQWLVPPHRPGYLLRHLLAAMEVRLTKVRQDGTPLYRLTSVDVAMPSYLATVIDADAHARVEDAKWYALVGADGLVREYRLNYRLVHNGTVIDGSRSVRYTSVNSTVVRRPSWYNAARNATRQRSAPGGSR